MDPSTSESSSIWCLFCLEKSSCLKNQSTESTAEVLKDEGLFHFLCKYLQIIQQDHYWDLVKREEGEMLPACTKCTNTYKQLAELYKLYQALETEVKWVVNEFRQFVALSSNEDNEVDVSVGIRRGSEFHDQFREEVLRYGDIKDEDEEEQPMYYPDMPMSIVIKEEPKEDSADDLSENGSPEPSYEFQMLDYTSSSFDNLRDPVVALTSDAECKQSESEDPCGSVSNKLKRQPPKITKTKLNSTPKHEGKEEVCETSVAPRRSIRARKKPLKILFLEPKESSASIEKKITTNISVDTITNKHADGCNVKVEKNTRKRNRNAKILKNTDDHTGGQIKKRRKKKCQYCEETFQHTSSMARHVFKIHPGLGRVFECPVCEKQFPTKHAVERHVPVHSEMDKRYACKLCDAKFKSKWSLEGHLTLEHGSEHVPCTVCGKKFISQSSMRSHFLCMHNNRPKKHICPICSKAFATKYQVNVHIQHHGDERPFICKICGKGFKTCEYLNTHRKCHLPKSIQKCKCEFCHKKFNLLTSCRVHKKSCKSNPNFKPL